MNEPGQAGRPDSPSQGASQSEAIEQPGPASAPERRTETFTSPGHIKLRLTIAYDGTAYSGWQTQKTGIGVQQKVEEALARLFPSKPTLHASSRTDTGVHALGMVAHFEVPKAELRFPLRKIPLATNANLPEDIRVIQAARCRPDFHARFQARGKQYRYLVWNHPAMNPLMRQQAWHVPKKLDLAAVRKAAAQFIGKRDFRAFAANRGYEFGPTIRTMTRLDVQQRGSSITFIIEADGFLYKMCRGIVGTLVQIGLGKLSPADVGAMFESRDRRVSGMTAPAHGLVLWKVFYARRAPGA